MKRSVYFAALKTSETERAKAMSKAAKSSALFVGNKISCFTVTPFLIASLMVSMIANFVKAGGQEGRRDY